MIKVIRKFFTGLLLLSLTAASYAQEDAGVEAIWRIGFGSRAMGMGRAFTAISNDNAALYYNPAGLDEIQQKSISLFYTNLVLDANYSFMSFTYPTLHTGTFGVAIGRIGSGSYGIRTDSPVDIISDAYYDQYRIYLGYGKEILEYLSVGANLKADYHTAITSEGLDGTKDLSSFSFGADIGVLYKGNDLPVVGNLRAGLNLINVLKPQNKLFQETDELPLTLRFGLAKPVPLSNENLLNIAVDLAKAMESEAPFHYNIGVEFRYHQIASVRAGFDEGTIAAGLGIMWKGVRFDYAYGNLSTESAFDAQHRFTLTYSFGSTKQEEMTLEKLSLEQRDSVMVEEAISVEKQNQIEKSFKAGMDYMEKNKWFNATVEFQQILSIDPFNREARKMFKQADSLLQLEYQKEQQALAEKQTSEAIAKQDREYIDYHYNKGREYLKKNQFTEALLEFNAALERDPKNKTLLEARDTAQRRLDYAALNSSRASVN
jgi:tetratricopeptide (TPR) repeat protein